MITQFIINGIVSGCMISLIAMGFSIIYFTTNIFHIAHGAIFTAGMYSLYASYSLLKLPLSISVIISLITVAIIGYLAELLVYLPLKKRKAPMGVVFISSLAIYLFIVNVIELLFGNDAKIISTTVEKTYCIADIILTRIQIVEVITFLFVILIAALFLNRTKLGKTLQAMSDNSLLLTVLGTNVNNTRILVFVLGSIFAGIAAILMAIDVGMDSHAGMPVILNAAVAMIIGGVKKFKGVILGSFVVGILQSLTIFFISSEWESAVTFLLLIIFLLFRPEGILGFRKRVEEA